MLKLFLIIPAIFLWILFFCMIDTGDKLRGLFGTEAGAGAMILTAVIFDHYELIPFGLLAGVLGLIFIFLAVDDNAHGVKGSE